MSTKSNTQYMLAYVGENKENRQKTLTQGAHPPKHNFYFAEFLFCRKQQKIALHDKALLVSRPTNFKNQSIKKWRQLK